MSDKNVFKYNMSFYYQSTIIYFVVFMIYIIVSGQFIEDSFTLITKDPIIYFLGIIVLVSLITLLYNIYKNRYLQIGEDNIYFIDRFRKRSFQFSDVIHIRILNFKVTRTDKNVFKLIRIKLKNRRRPLIIRPYDYENQNELLSRFIEFKNKIERN